MRNQARKAKETDPESITDSPASRRFLPWMLILFVGSGCAALVSKLIKGKCPAVVARVCLRTSTASKMFEASGTTFSAKKSGIQVFRRRTSGEMDEFPIDLNEIRENPQTDMELVDGDIVVVGVSKGKRAMAMFWEGLTSKDFAITGAVAVFCGILRNRKFSGFSITFCQSSSFYGITENQI